MKFVSENPRFHMLWGYHRERMLGGPKMDLTFIWIGEELHTLRRPL
jgi:hypothetical protein